MKKPSRSGILYNMVLPILFFELWNVLLAFVFIVIIETFIINKIVKGNFKSLFIFVLLGNLFSTLLGYFAQGVIRLLLTMLLVSNNINYKTPIVDGLLGNVGISEKTKFAPELIISILTSIIITFLLSVLIEKKVLIKYTERRFESKLISKAVVRANIVSYLLLTIWLFSNLYLA